MIYMSGVIFSIALGFVANRMDWFDEKQSINNIVVFSSMSWIAVILVVFEIFENEDANKFFKGEK